MKSEEGMVKLSWPGVVGGGEGVWQNGNHPAYLKGVSAIYSTGNCSLVRMCNEIQKSVLFYIFPYF